MANFTKQQRLLKKHDFDRLMNGAIRIVSSRLVIVGKLSNAQARLGLIVSKKVGNAVVRNRVKRLVRECFRARASEIGSIDIVVIARHRAASASLDEISRDLNYGLRKLAKINDLQRVGEQTAHRV